MFDYILNLFHPEVRREWDAFYPNNVDAIAKFLCHSNIRSAYKNPIDRCSPKNDILSMVPKKYHGVKIKDLLPIAPFRLIQFILAHKSFLIDAYKREKEYGEVIELLDNCPHGVTLICQNFSFTLLGGSRLPEGESMSLIDNLKPFLRLNYVIDKIGVSDYEPRFDFDSRVSKRDERTREDVYAAKHAKIVKYEDLDMFFQELYPYRDKIKSEEERIKRLLHAEDVEAKFQKKVLSSELRKLYYDSFIKSQNHAKDAEIEQKEYCLIHLRLLDSYVSKRLEEESKAIAEKWPLGYDWYISQCYDLELDHDMEKDEINFSCIKEKETIIKKNENIVRYNELRSKYPSGVDAFNKTNSVYDPLVERFILPPIEDVVIAGEEELKKYQINSEIVGFYDSWAHEQFNFSKECRDLRNDCFPSWGCYRYFVPFKSITLKGEENEIAFPVWQFFIQSFCKDENLDYTYNENVASNTKKIQEFKNKTRYFTDASFDKLILFINCIKEKYGEELIVLLGTSGIENYEFFNDYHFRYLKTKLLEKDVLYKQINSSFCSVPGKKIYVIVEVVTEFDHMIETCLQVIGHRHYNQINNMSKENVAHIVYVSLNKGLTSDEMKSLIQKTKADISKKQELEAQKREEERKKREDELLRLKKQKESIVKMQDAVSTWDALVGGIRYSYLFYYYPTTCDFEATEEEWYYRRLVWDFKNTPGKTSAIAHKLALDKAITMVKDKLQSCFDTESLKFLTLVCIPASSQAKNKARYEDFSYRICTELGMINAYLHISVISEKEEKHLGGSGLDTSKLYFDEEFFKGKYVLLFDDIITRGDSMRSFKIKMEQLGATVIGGICLGKTKHERLESSPTVPFPPKVSETLSSDIIDMDDLPF